MKDDEKWTYLRNKLDTLQANQAETNTILARNTASLEEHMRRTASVETRLVPIEKHVNVVTFLGALVLAAPPLVMGAQKLLAWLQSS